MYRTRYSDPEYFDIAERFTAHAEARGVHPATLAVAWVMAHPAVTAPIIGARNLEQLEASLARCGCGDDAEVAGRDCRALARAAAGHRPQRGTSGDCLPRGEGNGIERGPKRDADDADDADPTLKS